METVYSATRNSHPPSFLDLQGLSGRMHEVELTSGTLLMQSPVALYGSRPVWTDLDHGDTVQYTAVILGMGFQ